MAQADIRVAEAGGSASSPPAPPRFVVPVRKDREPRLRQSFIGLSRQTHPRLGVLAVDNASTDGSAALLEQALGADRVIRLERNVGFSSAVAAALQTSDAAEADYVLLLHDDAVLAPEAIAHMAEAADRIDGR